MTQSPDKTAAELKPLTAAERYGIVEMPSLEFTPEVAAETEELYQRVAHHIPRIEWPAYAPYVAAINRLKKQRNAVILAHNYQTPEIFHCVADIVGDSLQLAREAENVDADIIIQCGVHFMAETSKLLSPDKTVLIPDLKAGCSLAESITGADVRRLREENPGVPIVTYVNTSADVKAESDICCTSANAVQVVESFGVDRVLCIPDEFLAQNVAAQTSVTVIATAPIGEGASSAWAQAGIAAAVSSEDTVASHVADTLAAGDGIVDEPVIAMMAASASDRVHDLLELGVPFDRDLAGHLQVSREAAHSYSRIVRVRGDMAGRAIMQALVAKVRTVASILVIENATADQLLQESGRVTGVVVQHQDGSQQHLQAAHVVMATGGIGHLYQVTTNPAEACGSGIGMAARAGAMMADMEFVQFHPTALDVGRDPAPLATEALRGHGAHLINHAGERFMLDIDPDAEMAPRDVVARGIYAQVMAGRGAFLDCTTAIGAGFQDEFPTVYGYCRDAGIDPVIEPIPVIPAAHYFMGGILTDIDGRTTLPGLWACGEAASTGAHGANRLASNSLLEAVVFGARVAQAIKHTESKPQALRLVPDADITLQQPDNQQWNSETQDLVLRMSCLRQTMSTCFGVIRNAKAMREGLATIRQLQRDNHNMIFANSLVTAELIAVSALQREESRGGHYRSDFPVALQLWKHRSKMSLKDAQSYQLDQTEVA